MATRSNPGPVVLDGERLTLEDLETVARGRLSVALEPAARERVARARAVVDAAVARGDVVYGVTTGFGNFADVVIPRDRLGELQLNLVRSHAAGVGEPLDAAETRALMLLRANVLAKGFSGVRPQTLDLLVGMLNADVLPLIPSQGSVGASGDLAPLAHLALALVGEGSCRGDRGPRASAAALGRAGLAPVVLEAKEGLALINGTQLMAAVTGLALAEAWRLARTADVTGALALDALKGTDVAFDARIHAARPHPGQRASAANLRRLLQGSAIRASHRDCGKVQDAYSLRCIPQVHGAVRDALAFVTATLAVEINAATDNPMVFAETGELLSGGNFHGEPVALAADVLAIAAAELGSIAERRIERLVNPALSGLPAFLTREGGINSGLMLAQVTAAALASENKSLAHPASVDSIPTSANKEDHVSMGVTAARKAARAMANTRRILGIEAIAACQALEFHRPLGTSPALQAAYNRLRARVPPLERDRVLAPDIEAAADLVRDGVLAAEAASVCGTLE
jgi:histidine ammonia-lyase